MRLFSAAAVVMLALAGCHSAPSREDGTPSEAASAHANVVCEGPFIAPHEGADSTADTGDDDP
jgi:hypothetical protein